MNTGLETKEQLFEVMEQIAAEREAARPIVEKLVSSGEPIDDIEIPEGWRTAGFVHELTIAAGTMWQSDPLHSLPLLHVALAALFNISPQKYPTPLRVRLEGIAWKEIGYVHLIQSAYEAAFRAYDAAENCFEREPVLLHDAASTQLARALALTFIRKFDDGLPLIEKSASVFHDFGDTRREAMAQLIKGLVHQQSGELQIARAKYEQLLSAIRTTDDLHTLATLYHNLGIVYRDLGRPNDAVVALQRAREIYTDLGSPVDKTDWCLAGVLLATGEFSKALPILRRLRDAFLAQQMPQDAAEVALDIVEALIATNRTAEARLLTEEIVKEFVNANLNDGAITALSYLRDLLPEGQQARRAIRYVRSYVEKLRSEPARLFVPLDEQEK